MLPREAERKENGLWSFLAKEPGGAMAWKLTGSRPGATQGKTNL